MWRQTVCRQGVISELHGGVANAAGIVRHHIPGRQRSGSVLKHRAPTAQSAADSKSAPASRLQHCGLI